VTKSGSTKFHGTVYDFARNDAFDANAFFRNLQGQSKAKLRFNQFGGNLGGPAYIPKISSRARPKLFFFFNFEGTRATRPNGAAFVDIPGAEMLAGDMSKVWRTTRINSTQFLTGTVFAPGSITRDAAGNLTGGDAYPGNIVPKSVFSRQTPAFMKLLTAVDRSKGTPTPNVAENVRVPLNDSYLFYKNAKVARVDYNLSSKTNVFVRWADDAQNESTGLGIFTTTSYPIFPEYRKKPGASWSANVVSVVSPTMTNEFIFAYNHLTNSVSPSRNSTRGPTWITSSPRGAVALPTAGPADSPVTKPAGLAKAGLSQSPTTTPSTTINMSSNSASSPIRISTGRSLVGPMPRISISAPV
jgi:hypothetical protein